MADEQSPVVGPSRQEKNGLLRVTPTLADKASDKPQPQPTSSQPPPKTGKRPFRGGEISREPLTKQSRVDENDEARRLKQRKPRELDPAMLAKHFTMANRKELEVVKAHSISNTVESNRHSASLDPLHRASKAIDGHWQTDSLKVIA